MKILVQLQALHKIAGRLHIQAGKISGSRQFWQSVGEYMLRRTIKECFDKERAPDGAKWKPLSPARVKQRLKRHKTGRMKILQDTGELRRSVRYRASGNSVVIGSNLKYSKTQQFGRGKIPARPFLGFTHTDGQKIISMFAAYLTHHVFSGG